LGSEDSSDSSEEEAIGPENYSKKSILVVDDQNYNVEALKIIMASF